jgi:hypothetical protein
VQLIASALHGKGLGDRCGGSILHLNLLLLGVQDKRDRYLVIAKSVLGLREVGIVAVANNAWGSLAYGKRHGCSSRSIGSLDIDEAESRIGQMQCCLSG